MVCYGVVLDVQPFADADIMKDFFVPLLVLVSFEKLALSSPVASFC